MFIAIEHEIHDAEAFQECARRVFPLPANLDVHQFLPARDLSRAVCLYEAPSLEEVRDFLDRALAGVSTQRYFAVAEEQAIGLPAV